MFCNVTENLLIKSNVLKFILLKYFSICYDVLIGKMSFDPTKCRHVLHLCLFSLKMDFEKSKHLKTY